MEKETIELYSPFNAKNLTQDQLAAMQSFTKADVKALAEAYPNKVSSSAYLVLKDKTKPDNKQIFPLSTWKNFYELLKLNQTQYVAYSFKSIFKRNAASLKAAPVQDLTKEQAKAELKTATTQKPVEDKKPEEAGPVTEKSAEQIALEEANQIEGGGGENNTAVEKKPLDKMNLTELKAEYEEVFGEEPEEGSTKAQLKAAIQSKK